MSLQPLNPNPHKAVDQLIAEMDAAQEEARRIFQTVPLEKIEGNPQIRFNLADALQARADARAQASTIVRACENRN